VSVETPERIVKSIARSSRGLAQFEINGLALIGGTAPLSQAIRRARSKMSQGWLGSWPDLSENPSLWAKQHMGYGAE
jgi:hypothetical protein